MSNAPPEVFQPADDVHCWLDADSSVMLKAATCFGDPVELTADEARATAAALLEWRRGWSVAGSDRHTRRCGFANPL